MHCLWWAYRAHVEYLGIYEPRDGFDHYASFKLFGQGNIEQPTWGGIVPWVMEGLTIPHGLQMTIQYDIWTPEHYLADALPFQAKLIHLSDFGEKGITLAPAIYCDLDTQHAVFAEEIPDGNIVLAIQLRRADE